MPNLQEYLNQTYPTKQEKERVGTICFTDISPKRMEKIAENRTHGWFTAYLKKEQQKEIEGGELDLSEFVNLAEVRIDGNYLKTPLTKLKFSTSARWLELLICINNNLTSIDFLENLPNPNLMKILNIYNNNIQPTDIEIFSKFANLTCLKIGTEKEAFQNGKHNKFYGSLKSYQNLTKLERICIEATDVDRGLEHLPMSLAKSTAKRATEYEEGGYLYIECSPHDVNNRCSQIKEKLMPFDYDLFAWQLTGFCKALLATIKPESSDWGGVLMVLTRMLDEKIIKTRNELELIELHKSDKVDKIKRLESKLQKLIQTKGEIQERNIVWVKQ